MKKLLLLVLLVLLPLVGFAQTAELTADTVAAPVPLWQQALSFLLVVLGVVLSALAAEAKTFIKDNLKPALASWLKGVMHFRGSDVVADGLAEEVTYMADDLAAAFADGKVTSTEWDGVKSRAAARIKPRLINLAGFYKKDLDAWIDEQLNIQLGKLLYRNSSVSGLKIR